MDKGKNAVNCICNFQDTVSPPLMEKNETGVVTGEEGEKRKEWERDEGERGKR